MGAIVEAGLKIPDDVSVVGADDIAFARFSHPPLTTVRIPRDLAGRAAFDALQRMIKTKNEPDASTRYGPSWWSPIHRISAQTFNMTNGKVKVGIIGSQFEADIHAASFQIMPDEAEVVAIASPTAGNAEELARRYGSRAYFSTIARCWRERHRDGHHHGSQFAACADDNRHRTRRQTRCLREAALP